MRGAGLLAVLCALASCGPRTRLAVTVSGDSGGLPVEVLRVALVPAGAEGEPREVTFWPDGAAFTLPVTVVIESRTLAGDDLDVVVTAASGGRDVAVGLTSIVVAAGPDNAVQVFLSPLPAACGDGYAEDAEVCDGADFAGMSCETEGFEAGALACAADCSAIDTRGCETCGDGAVTGGEECDGTALDGATCLGRGFMSGTLACAADCTFDTSACVSGPPPVPTPRRPMNGTYTGEIEVPLSRRPAFIWEPIAWGTTITYELQIATDAAFTTGTVPVMSSAPVYQPVVDLTANATPPFGTRYYWHVRACAGADCSAYAPTWWVVIGGAAQDFNGDGCTDALAGAPNDPPGGPGAGHAYAYLGERYPYLEPGADLVLAGEAAGDQYGAAVTTTADLNGDGFGDLAVGAPGNDAGGADAGRVYVYFGGYGGAWNATAEAVLGGEAAGDAFGAALAGAGDVDGDEYADLVVGAPGASRAYVFFGGPGGAFDPTADAVLDGEAAGDAFGGSVSGAGDANGDGLADVLVGAAANGAGGAGAGRAYLYLGGAGALDAVADARIGGAAGDALGAAVGGGGDANADGFADFLVGAPGTGGGAGAAYVVFGSDALPFDLVATAALAGAAAGDGFGGAVANAADVDYDGYDDLIVGAAAGDGALGDEGTATIFLGGAGTAFDALADAVLAGAAPLASFGAAVGGAGDINGDGWADVIVGAPAAGTAAAWVYFGAATGVDALEEAMLTGAAGERTGASVR